MDGRAEIISQCTTASPIVYVDNYQVLDYRSKWLLWLILLQHAYHTTILESLRFLLNRGTNQVYLQLLSRRAQYRNSESGKAKINISPEN